MPLKGRPLRRAHLLQASRRVGPRQRPGHTLAGTMDAPGPACGILLMRVQPASGCGLASPYPWENPDEARPERPCRQLHRRHPGSASAPGPWSCNRRSTTLHRRRRAPGAQRSPQPLRRLQQRQPPPPSSVHAAPFHSKAGRSAFRVQCAKARWGAISPRLFTSRIEPPGLLADPQHRGIHLRLGGFSVHRQMSPNGRPPAWSARR